MPILLSDDSFTYAFYTKKIHCNGQSFPTIGIPEVKWCSCMGEHGYVRGDEISTSLINNISHMNNNSNISSSKQNSSPNNSNNIKSTNDIVTRNSVMSGEKSIRIICINSPAIAIVGIEFDITIRIINETGRPITLNLLTKDLMNSLPVTEQGLCVVGLSSLQIGYLDIGEIKDISLRIYPLSSGLHALRNILAIDIDTGNEYTSGTILKILVNDE